MRGASGLVLVLFAVGTAACGGAPKAIPEVAAEGPPVLAAPPSDTAAARPDATPDTGAALPDTTASTEPVDPAGADTSFDGAGLDVVLTDAWELADRVRRPLTRSLFEAPAAALAMDPAVLASLDSLLLAAVEDSVFPGAALVVGRTGGMARLRGYGTLDYGEDRLATPATLWDLASLTKVVGTTTAVMILEDEGRLELDAPVVRYLPWWSGGHAAKARVTVRQLLLHRAGLPSFRRWYRELDGEDAYRDAVAGEPLERAPDEATVYSDLGAMTLAWIVEAVAGEPLDVFLGRRVFAPLGMADTGFRPEPDLVPRTAPTEVDTLWRHTHVRGEVHDENAAAMGGVAGHAGLFSTAWDMAVFAHTLLGGGAFPPCTPRLESGVPCTEPRSDTVRIVEPGTVARFVRRPSSGPAASASRALGWDTPSGRSSAGDLFTSDAFGHTGFTGTSIWIDPTLDLYVVLLTNRVNPTRAETRHVTLRRAVHDLAVRALTDRSPTPREGAR